MPALVALRYNPVIKKMNVRLTAAGKPKMLIAGAAMRKLVHLIYGVLKSGVLFNGEFAGFLRRYLNPIFRVVRYHDFFRAALGSRST